MTSVYVAAGSNVEPERNLRLALNSLRTHYTLRVSPAYRNKAVGFEGDDFINLVVGFETNESVERVIERLHEAEAACGRPRNALKWAPRTMDLDLLLFGDQIREELRLPRADLLKRAYMLRPMAELAPEIVHPVTRKKVRQSWNEFVSDGHAMEEVEISGLL
jgi:2-amino-4-hydroxy-6-hydroxymethyldihydropteridine diphosphokinase